MGGVLLEAFGWLAAAAGGCLLVYGVSFDVRRAWRRRVRRRALRRERPSPAALPGRDGLGVGFEFGGGRRRRGLTVRSRGDR